MAGRTEEARRAMADLLADWPDVRLSTIQVQALWRRPDDYMRWLEGLRLAGHPE
jgi:hypothetical protein